MTLVELDELYNTNRDFKEYVDKYSKAHRTVPEYSLKCMIVKNYANYIKESKR